ncbi:MAG: TIGR02530 family flagellar biosynthesis protein [Bacillota bacterium]|nr:TIGR02530 family flagellar biosynthesis protein [Bacillota bacterium]
MGYRVVNGKLYQVGLPLDYDYNSSTKPQKKTGESFAEVLKKSINSKEQFAMSNHAVDRLTARNISFDENDMKKINDAINKAEQKGCNESVIFYKDTALVTSIKNRTVITVVDKDSAKGNIFTNIDSVVIL